MKPSGGASPRVEMYRTGPILPAGPTAHRDDGGRHRGFAGGSQAGSEALVPRTQSSHYNCRQSGCELRVQSGTRIIELLVSFDSEVRYGACGKLGELRNRDTSPPGRWTGEADVLPWQAVAGGFRRRGAHVGGRGIVPGASPGPGAARAECAGARAG